jgi:poly(3-hydroxybutyrate) depolymerase
VHDLCSGVPDSRKTHYECKGAGHYGIFSGRRWREQVYPKVKAFILENQPRSAPAPVVTAQAAPKKVATAKRAPTKK